LAAVDFHPVEGLVEEVLADLVAVGLAEAAAAEAGSVLKVESSILLAIKLYSCILY
jgi:hypothetical protein